MINNHWWLLNQNCKFEQKRLENMHVMIKKFKMYRRIAPRTDPTF